MFTIKKTQKKAKRVYEPPRMREVEMDSEELICTSAHLAPQVDELRNVNADNAAGEELYFEF